MYLQVRMDTTWFQFWSPWPCSENDAMNQVLFEKWILAGHNQLCDLVNVLRDLRILRTFPTLMANLPILCEIQEPLRFVNSCIPETHRRIWESFLKLTFPNLTPHRNNSINFFVCQRNSTCDQNTGLCICMEDYKGYDCSYRESKNIPSFQDLSFVSSNDQCTTLNCSPQNKNTLYVRFIPDNRHSLWE